MQYKQSLILFLFVIISTVITAQDFKWPENKKAAVCMTYDDGLDSHLDEAVPALNEYGIKGTFYAQLNSWCLSMRTEEWKEVAKQGHELGNHAIYHPCEGDDTYNSWVLPEHDLRNYKVRQIHEELRVANTFWRAMDGKTERTFAYNCFNYKAGGVSFVDSIADLFVSMRGVNFGMNIPGEFDIKTVANVHADGYTAEQMIALTEEAKEKNALLVFIFHGVGNTDHPLFLDVEEHKKFLKYLSEDEEVYSDTFINIMKYYIANLDN